MQRLIRHRYLMVAAAFMAAMLFNTAAAHAQLIGELEANIPFAFSVDNTRLPAGEYFIRPADDIGSNVLEIESANKNMAVFMMTNNSESAQNPKTSELTFDKIGNQYFLRDVTVEESHLGYTLVQSKAETKAAAMSKAKMEKHKITVKHHKTRASKP